MAGWAASGVVAGWAAVATVVATGDRSSKGIRDCGSKGTRDCDGGNCPVSVTTDAEQGGAAVGRRAAAVARGSSGWKATVTALEATTTVGNKGSRCELPVIALFRLQKMQRKGER
ncbi:hypothetical protein ECC01_22010 [Bacillus tequilensis]|nr:hypothetical protein [Bacillus tequilensis]